jgi:molecular chaperone GrpE
MTSKPQNQSDQQIAGSEANPFDVEVTGVGTTVAAPAPTSEHRANLEAAKAEAEEWRDRFLRKAAEMENFRKRTERERAEAAANVACSLLVEMLPVMDACDRAIESFREDASEQGKLKKYREGVELLYKQLTSTLNRLGVVPLEAKGQKFDPHLHDALTHLESQDYEDNTVVEELRRGYLYKGRLLRPAQVVVASRPKPKEDGATQK